MNKSLTPVEVVELLRSTKIPTLLKPALTRSDKLMIWAAAVAEYPHQLSMFHGIEYVSPQQYRRLVIDGKNIFDLGHREPLLREAGLTSGNIAENCEFFQLSPDELHYLSCDCHGTVTNGTVAHRIMDLATYEPGAFREPRNAVPSFTIIAVDEWPSH